MSDSNMRDELTEKHERIRQRRFDAIKRWVAYIEANPPEVWGEQQNTLINSQLESAREIGLDAEHYQYVKQAGRELSREQPTEEN